MASQYPRRHLLLAAGLCALVLGACANDDFSNFASDGGSDSSSPVQDARLEDPFGPLPDYGPPGEGARCYADVDVVFVLDVSSSMSFVLDTLASQVSKVINAANGLAPDSHFGLVGYVDNHLLDLTGPLEGGKVHTEAATLTAAFQRFQQIYTMHDRNPGDGPNGPTLQNPICEENALDALYAAAEEFPWRSGANRVIILATDDTFIERPDNYGDRDGDGLTDKTDFPREGDYPARYTLSETVTSLIDKKIRVFSFTKLVPPLPFMGCGTGRRLPWAAVPTGWSKPYNGQEAIPSATQGKNFDLDQVFMGGLSLTDTINDVVIESQCAIIE